MQRAELALKLKEAVAAEAKKRQVRKLKSVVQKSVPQNSGKTRDELAKRRHFPVLARMETARFTGEFAVLLAVLATPTAGAGVIENAAAQEKRAEKTQKKVIR